MPRLAQALKKITRRFGDNNEITFQPRGKAGVVRSISGTMMVIFGKLQVPRSDGTSFSNPPVAEELIRSVRPPRATQKQSAERFRG